MFSRYDIILRDGLPDWRQPVFYYRRVRKMGLIEFVLLIFLILTIGHYIVAWSIYLEKKFELVGLWIKVCIDFITEEAPESHWSRRKLSLHAMMLAWLLATPADSQSGRRGMFPEKVIHSDINLLQGLTSLTGTGVSLGASRT